MFDVQGLEEIVGQRKPFSGPNVPSRSTIFWLVSKPVYRLEIVTDVMSNANFLNILREMVRR